MISNRLKSLAKYVEENDKIIDVGCDHALLDIYLVQNNIVKSIIVSDVHKGAIDAGIDNIKKNKLSSKIDARYGDGLEVLTENDNINTVLISGMGSSTIINILNTKYLKNIDKLILQSNNDHFILRNYLVMNGYYIEAEEFITDNKKHYINIVFKKGNKRYKVKELRYGPILIKNKEYLEFELANCIKIKNLIPKMKIKYRLKLEFEIRYLSKLLKRI